MYEALIIASLVVSVGELLEDDRQKEEEHSLLFIVTLIHVAYIK